MSIQKRYLKMACLMLMLTKTVFVRAQMNMSGMQHTTPATTKNSYLLMMDTMMVKMEKIPAVTSPENDFIYQMIPHHEGAIAMAHFEILHGKNAEMIQLAKSILAEQSSEIQQMRLWLQQPGTTLKDTAGYKLEMDGTMKSMMDAMPPGDKLKNTDRAFAMVMVPHHQAAIDMARILLKYARQPTLTAYGNELISNEQIEIEQMKEFLN